MASWNPFENSLLLRKIMEQPRARWAEIFLEERSVVTLETGSGARRVRSEAFDSGAGVRLVTADGSWRQASASGGLDRAPESAVRSLLGKGAGDVSPSRAAQGQGCSFQGFTGPDNESDRLLTWMQEVTTAAGASLRGVLSRQEMIHLSTDSAPVGDVRIGVVIEARIMGRHTRERLPVRRMAARDVDGLFCRHPPAQLAAELREQAELAPDRRSALDGDAVVVFAPGSPGILIHELIGHLCEGERGATLLRGPGREDRPDVSPLLSVVDDPEGVAGNGGYLYDDEGVAPEKVVLLDGGRFAARVADRWSSSSALTSNGHGRRQSYRDAPMPRLGATIALAGTDDPEEIVRTTHEGILVQEINRGRCDQASGEFVVQVTRARKIEQGRLTRALHEFLLIGKSLDALSTIDRVGFDVGDDGGAYSCVRGGQAVPVIVGLPTLRIARLKVCSLATT